MTRKARRGLEIGERFDVASIRRKPDAWEGFGLSSNNLQKLAHSRGSRPTLAWSARCARLVIAVSTAVTYGIVYNNAANRGLQHLETYVAVAAMTVNVARMVGLPTSSTASTAATAGARSPICM